MYIFSTKSGPNITYGDAIQIQSLRTMNKSFVFIVENERLEAFRYLIESIYSRDLDIIEERLGILRIHQINECH